MAFSAMSYQKSAASIPLSEEDGYAWLQEKGFSVPLCGVQGVQEGSLPIHVACAEGNLRAAKWLNLKGATLREKAGSDLAFTPLIFAVRSGHAAVAEWIYETVEPKIDLHKERDSRGTTVAMYAAEKGQLELLKWLVSVGGRELLHDVNNKGSTPLIWSTHDASMVVMEWLYKEGCAIDAVNNEGNSAAMFATINGNMRMLRWLYDNGCPINVSNVGLETLPMLAADGGRLEVLQWLCQEKGLSVNDADSEGYTPLHFAAVSGHLEVVKWLVGFGAKYDECDLTGFTPVLYAAKYNHPAIVRFLVELGVSPNSAGVRSRATLAMLSVVNCPADLLIFLCEKGADLTKRTAAGTTAACFACQYGALDCLKWMLKEYPDLHQDKGEFDQTLPMYAARYGRLEVLQWLLATFSFPTQEYSSSGDSITTLAALEGHLELLKWLTKEHTSVSDLDADGNSCLMNAAAHGHLPIVTWLVEEKGRNIHETNHSGADAVMWAAQLGHIPILQYLHDRNASLHISSQQLSPMMFAAVGGQVEVIKWLHKRGVPLAGRDSGGNSVLHWAAQGGHIPAIEWLIRHGCSVIDVNSINDSPIDSAEFSGHTEAASWMQGLLRH